MSKNRRNNWIMAALALSLLVGTATITSCSSENVPEEPERPGANEAPSTLEIAGEHDVWMWTITLNENNCRLSGKCSGYTISLGNRIDSVKMAKLDATFAQYERLELRDSTVLTLNGDNKLTFAVSQNLKGNPIIVQGSDTEVTTLRIVQQDNAPVSPENSFRAAEGWLLQKSSKMLKDGSREVTVKVEKKE